MLLFFCCFEFDVKVVDKKPEPSSTPNTTEGQNGASLEDLLEQMMDEDGSGLESKWVERRELVLSVQSEM